MHPYKKYLLLPILALTMTGWAMGANAHRIAHSPAFVPLHKRSERFMTIGGSVAHGWAAKDNVGYLQRAFQTLSTHTDTLYQYYDRTIVGADGTQLATLYKGDYTKWLDNVKPQIVIISWGLLNDAFTKVTQTHFRFYLNHEIQLALSRHAVVFVVTPPVTKATYTEFKVQQPEYVHTESELVYHLHNPNVRLFNVFRQMEAYLTAHHQTYVPYMGNGWHPNTAGHILAGDLLYQDIIQTYGEHPIHFIT